MRLTFHIEGTRPLLMRAGRLADPLDPAAQALARLAKKRSKTPADHEALARAEWTGSLWLAGGRPCLPAEAIEACLVQAARIRRLGRAMAAAVACEAHAPLEFDGPSELEALWADPRFRLRSGVTVGRARVIRTRPRFPEWRAQVRLVILPGVLDPEQVREAAITAGAQIGIGDWRPRFGRFSVVQES